MSKHDRESLLQQLMQKEAYEIGGLSDEDRHALVQLIADNPDWAFQVLMKVDGLTVDECKTLITTIKRTGGPKRTHQLSPHLIAPSFDAWFAAHQKMRT